MGVDGEAWAGGRPSDSSEGAVVAATSALLFAGVAAFVLSQLGQIVGAFYARFGPDRVLEHPRRRITFELVCQSPGISISQIAQGLGCSINAVKYHLRVLERTRKVMLVQQGNATLAAPHDSARGKVEGVRRAFLLANDPKLAFLCDSLQGGARPVSGVVAELAKKFRISRRGALYVVERAARWGLLVRDTTGASGAMVRATT